MAVKNNVQLQIRLDAATKNAAKKVFDRLGMDLSSAVKIFFRQAINANNFPCELRDENGFTLHNAEILRRGVVEASRGKKSFQRGSDLIKDALSR